MCGETFKISLSKFQAYDTVLLTIAIIPILDPQNLFILKVEVYPFDQNPPFSSLTPPDPVNHHSAFCFSEFVNTHFSTIQLLRVT